MGKFYIDSSSHLQKLHTHPPAMADYSLAYYLTLYMMAKRLLVIKTPPLTEHPFHTAYAARPPLRALSLPWVWVFTGSMDREALESSANLSQENMPPRTTKAQPSSLPSSSPSYHQTSSRSPP